MLAVTLVSFVKAWTTLEFRRAAASVPIHCGVNVRVEPAAVTCKPKLVSEEVAKVKVVPLIVAPAVREMLLPFVPQYSEPFRAITSQLAELRDVRLVDPLRPIWNSEQCVEEETLKGVVVPDT